MDNQYFIYIVASSTDGVLYVGVTNNLIKRVWEHKKEMTEGFSSKYKTKRLVYYEITQNVMSAITREKQLKKWNRKWKIRLIEKSNPHWNDLYESIKA